MGDDGRMLRTPQLIELARRHGLTFVSIKALQDYRDSLKGKVAESNAQLV